MTVPARLLGRRVVAVEDLTRPWATTVTTSRATLEDGLVVVHQAGLPTIAGRAGIARRVRLGRALAAAAPGLGVPAVLDGDPTADAPVLVTALVAGRSGGELLGSVADATVLGRAAGLAARAVAAVPPRALGTGLPRRWADAGRLDEAARRWLEEARPHLATTEAAAATRVIERIPEMLAGAPVLAHGDLAPVNVIVDAGSVVGLLDLERVRVAPPAFDAAWLRLLVRHHHPDRWPSMGPAFLEAVGLGDDAATCATLDDLAILACLEQVATLARRSPARAAWAARAGEVLGGELPGP